MKKFCILLLALLLSAPLCFAQEAEVPGMDELWDQVESYEIKTPEDTLSMERYLGSGAIKGIGAALAARIVRHFKADTFRVMEEEPERLSDDDVMLLLKLIFHRQDTQELLKKLLERKKPETP